MKTNEKQPVTIMTGRIGRVFRSLLCVGLTAVFAVAGYSAPSGAGTVQLTGELGSPSATTTIDGKQLPAPDPNVIFHF